VDGDDRAVNQQAFFTRTFTGNRHRVIHIGYIASNDHVTLAANTKCHMDAYQRDVGGFNRPVGGADAGSNAPCFDNTNCLTLIYAV
jgi:NAD(P)H-dependent flavin oxidoreductase YrpB (nitropropane dioxygenase family)